MTQLLVTATGEEHGLINTVSNSVPFDDFKHMAPADKIKAEKLKKEECKIVKARYINHRGQNERLRKPYCRWSGEHITTWNFIPGNVYEVPMGLVNEVNDPNKRLKQRSEVLDASGKITDKDGPPEIIHEFVPISF